MRISDQETYALGVWKADAAEREFFGPRGDDNFSKLEMMKQISTEGYTRLEDYTDDIANKHTLNTVDVFFMGAGIMTDLVTEGLELKRTEEERKRKKSSSERLEDRK